jgi:hypothetical protein
MNFFYAYKVEYYADIDGPIIAEGITYGASWFDVMAHLIEMYGDTEMTRILDLSVLGEGGSCLEKRDITFKEEEK